MESGGRLVTGVLVGWVRWVEHRGVNAAWLGQRAQQETNNPSTKQPARHPHAPSHATLCVQASVPEEAAPSPAKTKGRAQGLAAAVAAGLSAAAAPETSANEYADMIKAVPQLAALGPVFKTCAPLQVRSGWSVCWFARGGWEVVGARARVGTPTGRRHSLRPNPAACHCTCVWAAQLTATAGSSPLRIPQTPTQPNPTLFAPQQLTEEETEYKVVCVRHVLEGHLVFQFNCTNTVKEQVCVCVAGPCCGGGRGRC